METLTKTDREALELALQLTQAEPDRVDQIKFQLKRDGWQETAEFASYLRQRQALRLAPWQSPPVWIDDPDEILAEPPSSDLVNGEYQAALLLREMLELGISRYHPDPLAAIEAAKAKGRRK